VREYQVFLLITIYELYVLMRSEMKRNAYFTGCMMFNVDNRQNSRPQLHGLNSVNTGGQSDDQSPTLDKH
jgi:hypothetical protein